MALTVSEGMLLSLVVTFAVGFTIGYLTSTWQNAQNHADMQRAIALLITLTWVASLIAAWAIPSYSVNIAVHGIMGGVAGYLFQGDGGFNINLGGK